MEGYRFRLRPGARDFIIRLSEANCELVLYTIYDYNMTLFPMAQMLNKKFYGLVDLGENCQGRNHTFDFLAEISIFDPKF